KFSKLSDKDAIRLCLLLSLEVIFMGRDLVSVVDDVYLRMVNDLDAWNLFPWDMDNRVFLCIGSLVDQSARNHTESIVIEEKVGQPIPHGRQYRYHLNGSRETDLEMDVDVERSNGIEIDPEIQAKIDECINYANALRDRGIDVRVVVAAID
nr:phospholipase-like, aminotransferase-like mobile domain protein [Tanacetum cinerariifolium]